MSYEVIITADGASMLQWTEAQDQFRRVLEARLGGLARFKPAFMAYTKSFDQGPQALSPEEQQLEAAWREAYADADTAAKIILGRTEGVDILVRLTT